MLRRNIIQALLAALGDRPVVLLHGARQTGKSTLAASLATTKHKARYLTLDDAGVLAAAHADAPVSALWRLGARPHPPEA